MFSIGLTLLSTVILEDLSNLYNIKSYTFDSNHLRSSLNSFNSSPAFSDILKGTVNNLLEFNIEKRLTPAELWTWISQYENHILSRENFVITQAPEKLHQQVNEIRQSFGNQSVYMPPPVSHIPQVHHSIHREVSPSR